MKGQCLKPLDQGVIFKIKTNGEGGIRTLAPLARSIPLAGAPLQPLEYFSNGPKWTRTIDLTLIRRALSPTEL